MFCIVFRMGTTTIFSTRNAVYFIKVLCAIFVIYGFLSPQVFAKNLRISWSPSISAHVGGYKLFLGKSSRNYVSSIDVGNTSNYLIKGLASNVTYYLSMKAYNISRTLESGFSNEINSNGIVTGFPTNAGLVAAYGFEEKQGNKIIDSSGYRNNGKIKQAKRVKGRFGKALQFDGINDWVTINDSAGLDFSNAFTLEAWIKAKTVRRGSIIFKEKADGSVYDLYAFKDINLPGSSFNDGTGYSLINGINQVPIKGWVHLAATFDGLSQNLFINGVEVNASPAQKATIQPSNEVLRFGGNSIWGDYFRGVIDEVRIYNRALTGGEIQSDLQSAIVPRTAKKK